MNSDPAIKMYEAPNPPVEPFKYPTMYDPANDPNAPILLINAIAPPATFRGRTSGMIAKNAPYGAYIDPPAMIRSTKESQKLLVPIK